MHFAGRLLLAYWIIYRDMLGDPVLDIFADSYIAFVGFLYISGKVAPSHGQGIGQFGWVASVVAWICLMTGVVFVSEGPDTLKDLDVVRNGIWVWLQELFA